MANRSKDRRARSRKRRPADAPPTGSKEHAKAEDGGKGRADGKRRGGGPADGSSRAKARTPQGASRVARSSPTAPTYGERPPAPWHPLPLSELLILVGAVVAALGFARVSSDGLSSGGPGLLAGIVAVGLGTIEVTLREHRSGYRSHTVMLALLLVLAFHSAVLLGLSLITTVPRLFNVGLLALDVALFAFLFKLLRARFLEARHARVLREG